MVTNDEPSTLARQVVGQWKLWIVAVAAVLLAVLLSTQTGDMRFHVAFFALIAVGAVLYALLNINKWRNRPTWQT